MSSAHAWKLVYLLVWAILGLGLIANELVAIARNNPADPPLTYVIVQYVPWPVMFVGLSWLCWHFAKYYAEAGKLPL